LAVSQTDDASVFGAAQFCQITDQFFVERLGAACPGPRTGSLRP
jgi:hypothetical protein